MKLPHAGTAEVAEAKIKGYLLAPDHPRGGGKAAWFAAFGFAATTWPDLAQALRDHACEHDVARIEDSPFGLRYVIEGPLRTPDGRDPAVRSVWFVERGEQDPRFVTAYPLRRSSR